jgi:hypothetical protein
MTHQLDPARSWRTSSHSGSGNNCIQAATCSPGIAARDSKDPHGPVLEFTADAWESFTRAIKTSTAAYPER